MTLRQWSSELSAAQFPDLAASSLSVSLSGLAVLAGRRSLALIHLSPDLSQPSELVRRGGRTGRWEVGAVQASPLLSKSSISLWGFFPTGGEPSSLVNWCFAVVSPLPGPAGAVQQRPAGAVPGGREGLRVRADGAGARPPGVGHPLEPPAAGRPRQLRTGWTVSVGIACTALL